MKESEKNIKKVSGEKIRNDEFFKGFIKSIQGTQDDRFTMRMDIGFGMFALIEGPVKHKNELCKELRSQVRWLFDYAHDKGEDMLQKHQPPQKVTDDIVGKGGYA